MRRPVQALRHIHLVAAAVLASCFSLPLGALDVQSEILIPAQEYIGAGYCRGGTDVPCFDCSGFVLRLYRPLVPELPRVSRDMARVGRAVQRRELHAGDLVFFTTGSRPGVITHVAVYMGQDSIIHAISDGPERGVTVTRLSARYWDTRYHSARRVLAAAGGDSAAQAQEAPEELRFADGRYRGSLRNGEPHGQGVMLLDNGDRYVGEFRNGAFHGTGRYEWADGSVHEGEFRNGAVVDDAADDAPADTESAPRRTYVETASSAWDEWNGIVRGDFEAWMQAEEEAFEEFMRTNRPGGRP